MELFGTFKDSDIVFSFSNLKKHGDFRTFIDIEGCVKNVHEHVSPEDPWDWAYLPTFTMNRNSPMQYIYIYAKVYIFTRSNLPFHGKLEGRYTVRPIGC